MPSDGQYHPQRRLAPVALTVRKRGRVCVVAKITTFVGSSEPILAVAWRGQRGTATAVSEPEAAIAFALQRGCRWFVVRDDRRRRMWRCSVRQLATGWWRDGERYVRLADMEVVAWRPWLYAKQMIALDAPTPVVAQPAGQLAMSLGAS